MPRSRSMSIRSRYCARIDRSSTTPVSCSIRSARVDLPWSMWAMMQKLRMRSGGVNVWSAKLGTSPSSHEVTAAGRTPIGCPRGRDVEHDRTDAGTTGGAAGPAAGPRGATPAPAVPAAARRWYRRAARAARGVPAPRRAASVPGTSRTPPTWTAAPIPVRSSGRGWPTRRTRPRARTGRCSWWAGIPRPCSGSCSPARTTATTTRTGWVWAPGEWDREGRPSWVRLDRVLDVPEDGIRREGAVLGRTPFRRRRGPPAQRPRLDLSCRSPPVTPGA